MPPINPADLPAGYREALEQARRQRPVAAGYRLWWCASCQRVLLTPDAVLGAACWECRGSLTPPFAELVRQPAPVVA